MRCCTKPSSTKAHSLKAFDFFFSQDSNQKLLKETAKVKLDPHMGCTPHKLRKLWSAKRIILWMIMCARIFLNYTESIKELFEKTTKLWTGSDPITEEGLSTTEKWLAKHRLGWVTMICTIEFSVLTFLIIQYFIMVLLWCCNRIKWVSPRVMMNNPQLLSTFSVLQFAQFLNLDATRQYFDWLGSWMQYRMVRADEFRGKRQVASMRSGWQQCCINTFKFVILPLVWMICCFCGIVAFLTKISFEMGDQLFTNVFDWSFSDFTDFIGFVNQCVGIVPINAIKIEQILSFRFSGSDSSWNAREQAVVAQYLKLLMLLAKEYMGSMWRTMAFLATMTSNDYQALLLDDRCAKTSRAAEDSDLSDDDLVNMPEGWMYEVPRVFKEGAITNDISESLQLVTYKESRRGVAQFHERSSRKQVQKLLTGALAEIDDDINVLNEMKKPNDLDEKFLSLEEDMAELEGFMEGLEEGDLKDRITGIVSALNQKIENLGKHHGNYESDQSEDESTDEHG